MARPYARKALRIITENDEDRARQLAGIDLSSLFLIERRIIDPTVCLALFATALA